ncbi:MAG: sugar-binding protein [Planctomycetes bacterium]|nr:sugar-binding protein [Planctomycetota bacterium]
MRSKPLSIVIGLLVSLLMFASCGGSGTDGKTIRVGFITNGTAAPFWLLAKAGAHDAAQKLGVTCDTYLPPNGSTGEQQEQLEIYRSQGFDGIAISPIDAAGQTSMIDEACSQMPVITHDSDAPESKRRCFVGIDNYQAGREVGRLVKESLPDGGKVMLLIGNLDQDNAQRRRQGVIDELLDRQRETPSSYDVPDAQFLDGKYKIVGTRVDSPYSVAQAQANAEQTISDHADIGCMVGLFAHHPGAILQAVKDAGKAGAIQIVGFDESQNTLQGILDGHIHGTVVQDPYQYGYRSVEILTALAKGDASVVPANGWVKIPPRSIRRADAQAMLDQVNAVLAK